VAKLSLLLFYCAENNLPSTLFNFFTEFNKNSVFTCETAAHNFCNAYYETLGVFCKGLSFNYFCKQFCYENPYPKEVGERQQSLF